MRSSNVGYVGMPSDSTDILTVLRRNKSPEIRKARRKPTSKTNICGVNISKTSSCWHLGCRLVFRAISSNGRARDGPGFSPWSMGFSCFLLVLKSEVSRKLGLVFPRWFSEFSFSGTWFWKLVSEVAFP